MSHDALLQLSSGVIQTEKSCQAMCSQAKCNRGSCVRHLNFCDRGLISVLCHCAFSLSVHKNATASTCQERINEAIELSRCDSGSTHDD